MRPVPSADSAFTTIPPDIVEDVPPAIKVRSSFT
jgi:hypothetical protein